MFFGVDVDIERSAAGFGFVLPALHSGRQAGTLRQGQVCKRGNAVLAPASRPASLLPNPWPGYRKFIPAPATYIMWGYYGVRCHIVDGVAD